ncbi:MAG: transglycosylase SLT domain-containing protein [Syntrophobacteria bacterium]
MVPFPGRDRGAARFTRGGLPACLVRKPALLGMLLGLLLAAAPGLIRADIYRYVDEHGVVHFSNTPTNPRYRLFIPEHGSDIKEYFHRYDREIKEAARENGVDFSLVKAVIKAESDFDHRAVSRAGAQGLMQLMPETARDLAVDNPFDPSENIRGGVRYLKWLLQRFENDVSLALAAYNAGEGAVKRYGRIPPFEQTRVFIDRVFRYWDEFKFYHEKNP